MSRALLLLLLLLEIFQECPESMKTDGRCDREHFVDQLSAADAGDLAM